jgi:DNA-binding MltR family transcriptional regulator
MGDPFKFPIDQWFATVRTYAESLIRPLLDAIGPDDLAIALVVLAALGGGTILVFRSWRRFRF